MKAINKYKLQIQSQLSLLKPSDYLACVRQHCEFLPEYMPIKWGWSEPMKQLFDPAHPEFLLDNGKCENVWWKRTGKHKAEGSWMKRWGSTRADSQYTHSSIDLTVYETALQDNVLNYLKVCSQHNAGDFGFLDGLTEKYKPVALLSGFSPYGDYLSTTTHRLRHWLPDMPWAVVFGSAYVRMFGKDKLMNTPAYKVEDIGKEMVFIQLTPRLEDIHEQFYMVMDARAVAKHHLGEECFFKPELAYDYREEPEKAGKVFRVPVFELKPD